MYTDFESANWKKSKSKSKFIQVKGYVLQQINCFIIIHSCSLKLQIITCWFAKKFSSCRVNDNDEYNDDSIWSNPNCQRIPVERSWCEAIGNEFHFIGFRIAVRRKCDGVYERRSQHWYNVWNWWPFEISKTFLDSDRWLLHTICFSTWLE